MSFFVVLKLSTLKPWSIHLSFLDFTYLYFIFIFMSTYICFVCVTV